MGGPVKTTLLLLALIPGLAAMTWVLAVLFSLYLSQPVVGP